MDDKRPRHYADEIAALSTKKERREALEQVPKEWRALVRRHVENTFFIRRT